MQFVLILAVLGALAMGEHAPPGEVDAPLLRAALSLAAMLLPPLLARLLARQTVADLSAAGDAPDSRQALRRFSRLRTAQTVMLMATAAGILGPLGWARLVRFDLAIVRVPLLDETLLLLPLLGPLLLSWAAYYDVDRWLRRREIEEGAANPENDGSAAPALVWTRGEYVAYQARTHLMLVLAPLVPLVATQDVLQLAAPEMMAGEAAWLALLPPLAAVVIGFPWLLRRMWKAAPLPVGPLRCRLEQAALRWGLRVRDIMVWNTERMVVNAAVAGFVPGWRYVFLSDALIEHFSPSEMEAVFGHEVGHIRHRHLLLRALVLLAPLSVLSLVHVAWPQGLDGWQASSAAWIGPTALSGLAVAIVAGLYVAAVFGYCSRRFERQADLFGCRIASTVDGEGGAANLTPHGVRTFVAALEKLAAFNGISREARSWQHDSIARRVAFLEQAAVDPRREGRCHRQVRLLGGLAVAVVAAGLVLPILTG